MKPKYIQSKVQIFYDFELQIYKKSIINFLDSRSLQYFAELKFDYTYETSSKSLFRFSDRLRQSQSCLSLGVITNQNIGFRMAQTLYLFLFVRSFHQFGEEPIRYMKMLLEEPKGKLFNSDCSLNTKSI